MTNPFRQIVEKELASQREMQNNTANFPEFQAKCSHAISSLEDVLLEFNKLERAKQFNFNGTTPYEQVVPTVKWRLEPTYNKL